MNEEQKAKLKDILEWGYCIVIAVVLALIVRYYVGTPTIVKQSSMFPTFKQNDRLILNRLYRTCKTAPSRGDVITFEAPSVSYLNGEKADLQNPIAIYKNRAQGLFYKFMYNVVELGKTSYIKRVIGLPGEHIQIKDGRVYINGNELEEKYLADDIKTEVSSDDQFIDLIVPQNTVFVMGDNRPLGKSMDSRRFGCIPYEKIEGKVVLRFWPLNSFQKI